MNLFMRCIKCGQTSEHSVRWYAPGTRLVSGVIAAFLDSSRSDSLIWTCSICGYRHQTPTADSTSNQEVA